MTKVLLADDHPLTRTGIKDTLAAQRDIRVVDEASNGVEALEKISKGEFDLVILDISMPGKDGLEVLNEIRKRKLKVPVLILSVHDDGVWARHCIKAGATGYLTKNAAEDQLMRAVRALIAGKHFVSSDVAEKIVFSDPAEDVWDLLSPREKQVVKRLGENQSNKEIAAGLKISPKTLATYCKRICQKFKFRDNEQLKKFARRSEVPSRRRRPD